MFESTFLNITAVFTVLGDGYGQKQDVMSIALRNPQSGFIDYSA